VSWKGNVIRAIFIATTSSGLGKLASSGKSYSGRIPKVEPVSAEGVRRRSHCQNRQAVSGGKTIAIRHNAGRSEERKFIPPKRVEVESERCSDGTGILGSGTGELVAIFCFTKRWTSGAHSYLWLENCTGSFMTTSITRLIAGTPRAPLINSAGNVGGTSFVVAFLVLD